MAATTSEAAQPLNAFSKLPSPSLPINLAYLLTQFGASLILALAFALSGKAADRIVYVPLETAVQAARAAGKIDGSVKFYLAEAQIDQVLRTNIVTNKKTNAVFKGDKGTSLHVAQSAVIALHNAARKAGADAVVNIVSYYRKQEYRSNTDIECHAGALLPASP